PEEPTGYFGEVTIDAVKQFQRDRELDADGIVGSETEAALFEDRKARSNGPFNTDSFLASPESQPSIASSPSQPATSEEKDETTSPALPPPTISSSQPERSLASEDESFLSETLEPAPAETAEAQTPSESEEGEPPAVAERAVARAQLLKVGTRGELVKQLQEKLQDAGFTPGAIDGIYGQQTKKSVIAFQRSRGLFVDGIAGQQTLSALKIGSSPTPSQRLYTVKVRNS
ncbi:MAG: peptidoglycan-binding protein, partial [Cyanobacteriota bacterium]|nr:peptidoglycan-binding protein [Cyanobacteriota bacterium]